MIMPYSKTVKNNYEMIWKDLLKIKIKILYDLSVSKNIDFQTLINDELPDANKFKDIWENDYIF